jgi:tetratricopeptide (TPR) repeat protein
MRLLIPILVVIVLSQYVLQLYGNKSGQVSTNNNVTEPVERVSNGDWNKSPSTRDRTGKKPSGSALMLTVSGISCRKRGDYVGAIENLNKAIEIDADLADAYCQRAFAWWQSDLEGRIEHALSDSNRAIGIDPETSALVYIIRGQAYVEDGQLKAAIDDFGHAIVLNPDSYSAFGARAYTYAEQGELSLARRDILKALSLDPPANDRAGLEYMLRELDANHP